MYTYAHSLETTVTAAAIFTLYADVSLWPLWDVDVESVTLDGPVVVGATGTLIIHDGHIPFPITIIAVDFGRGFINELYLTDDDLVVTFRHTLQPLENGGTRITHAIAITGLEAEIVGAQIGPQIAASVPASVAALAAHARERMQS